MNETIITSETSFYKTGEEINTDVRSNFLAKTHLINKKAKPFISATVFYGRFKGLNLLLYRDLMTSNDFYSYISYVGEESIGVKQGDFDVFYPEDN